MLILIKYKDKVDDPDDSTNAESLFPGAEWKEVDIFPAVSVTLWCPGDEHRSQKHSLVM